MGEFSIYRKKEMNEPRIVYEPNSRERLNVLSAWKQVVKNVTNNRSLLKEMISISIRSQYKKSFVGVAWMFFLPLITIAVWLLLNKSGIFNPGKTDIPFPVYVMITSTIWAFFYGLQDILSRSISQGANHFLMAEFPHEIIVLEKVVVQLVYFIAPMLMNFVVLFIFDIPISWKAIFLPLVILPLLFLSIALGLLFSILEVVAVDLGKLMNKAMSTLIYFTPIIYSPDSAQGILGVLVKWNPLTYLISSAREIIVYGVLYHPVAYLYSSLFSLVLLIVSVRIYYIAEARIMERVAV